MTNDQAIRQASLNLVSQPSLFVSVSGSQVDKTPTSPFLSPTRTPTQQLMTGTGFNNQVAFEKRNKSEYRYVTGMCPSKHRGIRNRDNYISYLLHKAVIVYAPPKRKYNNYIVKQYTGI